MCVMGRRLCSDNGSSGGGPNDFLAGGGPKFEVTPLLLTNDKYEPADLWELFTETIMADDNLGMES